jgi:hypothetical protein
MTALDPHIVEKVRRMKGDGARHREIAMTVGMSPSAIGAMCSRRGIRRGWAGCSEGRIEMVLGVRLVQAYQKEAERRGIRFDRFMRQMLLTIATDNLFTAILDDGK